MLLMLVVCGSLAAHAAPVAGTPSTDVARPSGMTTGVHGTTASLSVEVVHPTEARAVDSAKA
ncbi:hypothetical protein, partial [Stenotrophomonas maltophilia]|uniref:hypothetical protein n=1 Tax=Stenotrophomonas maltophilia TaxID=40324 RepID=UPI0013DD4E30